MEAIAALELIIAKLNYDKKIIDKDKFGDKKEKKGAIFYLQTTLEYVNAMKKNLGEK
jgi:hypothetical protein